MVPLPSGLEGPSMAFSPDGKHLASLENNAAAPAGLWDLHTGQKIACPQQTPAALVSLCFSSNGRFLGGLSKERVFCLWKGENGLKLATTQDRAAAGGNLVAHGEGFRLASARPDQTGIRVIDLSDGGQQERTLGNETSWLPSPTLSPNGKRLAAVSKEGTLHLWDADIGKVLLKSSGRDQPYFSADGKYLIRPTPGKGADLWDAGTGKPAGLRLPSKPWSNLARFSPDGRKLALPIEEGKVLLWNTTTGKPMATLRGHGSVIAGLVFSGDNRVFTSSADDAAVKVWDAVSGLEIYSLYMHSTSGRGGELLLSSDGRRLARRGPQGIRVWDATPVPQEVINPAGK